MLTEQDLLNIHHTAAQIAALRLQGYIIQEHFFENALPNKRYKLIYDSNIIASYNFKIDKWNVYIGLGRAARDTYFNHKDKISSILGIDRAY